MCWRGSDGPAPGEETTRAQREKRAKSENKRFRRTTKLFKDLLFKKKDTAIVAINRLYRTNPTRRRTDASVESLRAPPESVRTGPIRSARLGPVRRAGLMRAIGSAFTLITTPHDSIRPGRNDSRPYEPVRRNCNPKDLKKISKTINQSAGLPTTARSHGDLLNQPFFEIDTLHIPAQVFP